MSAVPAPDRDRDPYLELPLDGVRLVEASAGTGKTFTLATLVTRLVVERGLRVGQVLAVTFTEAATQELRKRIRERLLLAMDLVDAPAVDGEDAEAALTRDILQAHLARSGEEIEALRRRLRAAALEIDLAAIFTIHGFCARVLREHALESGQGFDPPELLANDRGLREELAADLWRAHGRDAAGADDLAELWKGGPSMLAADLGALMREPVLVPPGTHWRMASATTARHFSRSCWMRWNARCCMAAATRPPGCNRCGPRSLAGAKAGITRSRWTRSWPGSRRRRCRERPTRRTWATRRNRRCAR